MYSIIFIAALFGSVKSSGIYNGLSAGSQADVGLYGNGNGNGDSLGNKNTVSSDNNPLGLSFPPESAIDQFEVGYGGTYYRRGQGGNSAGENAGSSASASSSSNLRGSADVRASSFISQIHSGGPSFDKPLDVYREEHRNPFGNGAAGVLNNLSPRTIAELKTLAALAENAKNEGLRVDISKAAGLGQSLVENHPVLGPLFRKGSLNHDHVKGSASSSSSLGLGYYNSKFVDALRLNEFHSALLAKNLAKLSHSRPPHNHGPPGPHPPPPPHHFGGYADGPHHHKPLNLDPLFGKIEAVDAHLKDKLKGKASHLAQLENEKQALIHAAGKAALGSIREKEKLVHLYGQLGLADALDKPKYGPPPPPPPPGYGLPQDHGYNPYFAPVDSSKVSLPPAKSLAGPYFPRLGLYDAPPAQGDFGFAQGPGNHGEPLPHFADYNDYNPLPIVPIYDRPIPVKQVHNIIVKEELKGHHYYGPGAGHEYAAFGKKSLDHGPAPYQQPGPYPQVQEIAQTHKFSVDPNIKNYAITLAPAPTHPGPPYGAPIGDGGSGPHPHPHFHNDKLNSVVENVARNTAQQLVGALTGIGYPPNPNGHDHHHGGYGYHK